MEIALGKKDRTQGAVSSTDLGSHTNGLRKARVRGSQVSPCRRRGTGLEGSGGKRLLSRRNVS